MIGLEIFLIIAGFACLCISSFAAQKTAKQSEENVQAAAVWTEKEEQMIRERVDEILSARRDEMVETTEEQMNRLCNDKIMAVDEFSRQILEKIESNHQEVVFMYNMLNEKKKEVKDVVATIPVRRAEDDTEKKKETPDPQKKVSRQTKTTGKEKKAETEKKGNARSVESAEKSGPLPRTAIERLAPQEEIGAELKPELKPDIQKPVAASGRKQAAASVPGNVNLQIQKMHKEGKSVLEISKELNIGQGEVNLVIALYGGRKG